MENRIFLQNYIEREDYKKTFEMIIGEGYESIIYLFNKDNKIKVELSYKLKNGNPYSAFGNSHTYDILILSFDGLPQHYISSKEEGNDILGTLCNSKYHLPIDNSCKNSHEQTKTYGSIFELFLCKTLKEKYKDNKTLLKEIEKFNNKAKNNINCMIINQEKLLNLSKQNLNKDFDLDIPISLIQIPKSVERLM